MIFREFSTKGVLCCKGLNVFIVGLNYFKTTDLR